MGDTGRGTGRDKEAMMEPGTTTMAATGPQPGELIPDFFGRAADGRTVYRREYKGRRHLVLCFIDPSSQPDALLHELAIRHPAFRATGAEIVVFCRDIPPGVATPYPILADTAGQMHERYGVTTSPLVIAADRYGEVVLRRPFNDPSAALDEALAAIEWMQTRCSL